MADKNRVLSAFLLILSLVPVLTTNQWQGIFCLYLAQFVDNASNLF